MMVVYFFVGALLSNGAPHFNAGVMGRKFPTPFARPSSALINVLWGMFNWALAGGILFFFWPNTAINWGALVVGFVVMTIFSAVNFSRQVYLIK